MALGVADSCMFFWSLNTSACASWVQAWGSILALVFGMLALRHAHKLRERSMDDERKNRRLALLETIHALLVDAYTAADGFRNLAGPDNPLHWQDKSVSILETTIRTIERLDISILNGYTEIEPIVEGLGIMRTINVRLARLKIEMPVPSREFFEDRIGYLVGQLEQCAKRVHGQIYGQQQ